MSSLEKWCNENNIKELYEKLEEMGFLELQEFTVLPEIDILTIASQLTSKFGVKGRFLLAIKNIKTSESRNMDNSNVENYKICNEVDINDASNVAHCVKSEIDVKNVNNIIYDVGSEVHVDNMSNMEIHDACRESFVSVTSSVDDIHKTIETKKGKRKFPTNYDEDCQKKISKKYRLENGNFNNSSNIISTNNYNNSNNNITTNSCKNSNNITTNNNSNIITNDNSNITITNDNSNITTTNDNSNITTTNNNSNITTTNNNSNITTTNNNSNITTTNNFNNPNNILSAQYVVINFINDKSLNLEIFILCFLSYKKPKYFYETSSVLTNLLSSILNNHENNVKEMILKFSNEQKLFRYKFYSILKKGEKDLHKFLDFCKTDFSIEVSSTNSLVNIFMKDVKCLNCEEFTLILLTCFIGRHNKDARYHKHI